MRLRFLPPFRIGILIALACLMPLPFLGVASRLMELLIAAAGLSLVVAVVLGVRPVDRFSLDELRRTHEREELRILEEELPPAGPMVTCVRCGNVYDSRIPVCPECRHPA